MIQPSTRPPGTDWHPLDVGAYSLQSPGMAAPVRVTTDADVFDASSDNHQLFSPGGEVFESLESEAAGQPVPNADGVCWLVTQQDGRRECVVQTHYGPQRAETVESLLIAIENIGEPGPPPYSDWPGVINSTIA